VRPCLLNVRTKNDEGDHETQCLKYEWIMNIDIGLLDTFNNYYNL
jgi:hypothetical protein